MKLSELRRMVANLEGVSGDIEIVRNDSGRLEDFGFEFDLTHRNTKNKWSGDENDELVVIAHGA